MAQKRQIGEASYDTDLEARQQASAMTALPWLSGLPSPNDDVLLQRSDPTQEGAFESARNVHELFGAGAVGGMVFEVRARDYALLVSVLRDSLSEIGARQWFSDPNEFLNGDRPISLLREGKIAPVFSAAEALVAGYYG